MLNIVSVYRVLLSSRDVHQDRVIIISCERMLASRRDHPSTKEDSDISSVEILYQFIVQANEFNQLQQIQST